MYNDEKIWSIELGEDLEVVGTDEEYPSTPKVEKDEPRIVLRKRKPTSAKAGKKVPFRLHFALLAPLTWLMGPFAILLTPEGRLKRDWAIMGVVSGLGWIAAFAWGRDMLTRPDAGAAQGPLVFLMAALLLTGFTAWARAVRLAGSPNRPPDHKLILPMRRPWGTGLMGFVAPGLGLLVAGHPRRAAAVLWLGWIPVAALVFLAVSPSWWNFIGQSRVPNVDAIAFEKFLLGAFVLLAVGVAGWLVQALEGARLTRGEGHQYSYRRGDLYGLALLAAVMALFAVADPGPVARRLGREAQGLRSEGYRLIPLTMVKAAAFLDPGRTDYTVIALEIYGELGQEDRSRELRRQLDRNLASYQDLVRRDEAEGKPIVPESPSPAHGNWTFGNSAPWLLVAPPGWNTPSAPKEKKDPERLATGSPSQE